MDGAQLVDHAFYLAAVVIIVLLILVTIDKDHSNRRRDLERENLALRNQIAKFDGDGDGRIGGSRKRSGQ